MFFQIKQAFSLSLEGLEFILTLALTVYGRDVISVRLLIFIMVKKNSCKEFKFFKRNSSYDPTLVFNQ